MEVNQLQVSFQGSGGSRQGFGSALQWAWGLSLSLGIS